jgi:2,4-dienoyl-CoA reductase-like NADH-dependent reductase (Old Yellow Enzyme family)
MSEKYPKVAQLKSVAAFRERLRELDLELPLDEQVLSAAEGSPLAEPLAIGSFLVGNRWCIHPMEGWDAERDGSPSPLTLRRWEHFGRSGAKLIWGGEAAAVQPSGRANPNQTLATPSNRAGLARLLQTLLAAHRSSCGTIDDLYVGLQLTHSGRFCRPHSSRLEPRIAYRHPLLDAKFGIRPDDDGVVLSDAELEQLIDDYVIAAGLAAEAGFQFVDIKACHGYLLHEFLSAHERPGRFGGDLAGRARLLTTIIQRVRETYPSLAVLVRLSVFDFPPFEAGEDGGRMASLEQHLPYRYGFGINPRKPLELDLTEPLELIGILQSLGVTAVNITAGSPYYNPHCQRPAIFPPSDGYQPPEDPLVGVVRQIQAARQCKAAFPKLPMVGTAYTYLQDYLPHVAQALVRAGWIDFVGLGRMVLSYPELPADTLAGHPFARKRVCRTFSDCTTGPRKGLASGCYPLDPFYKALPQAEQLKAAKKA